MKKNNEKHNENRRTKWNKMKKKKEKKIKKKYSLKHEKTEQLFYTHRRTTLFLVETRILKDSIVFVKKKSLKSNSLELSSLIFEIDIVLDKIKENWTFRRCWST